MRKGPVPVPSWSGIPSFFLHLATCRNLKMFTHDPSEYHARISHRHTSQPPSPTPTVDSSTEREHVKYDWAQSFARTLAETDGEQGNNDCNTADTCLDRRLRHAVFSFADRPDNDFCALYVRLYLDYVDHFDSRLPSTAAFPNLFTYLIAPFAARRRHVINNCNYLTYD